MIDFVSICSNACQSIINPLHFLDNHPNKYKKKNYWKGGGTGIAYVLKGRGLGFSYGNAYKRGEGVKKGRFFAYVLIECPLGRYASFSFTCF